MLLTEIYDPLVLGFSDKKHYKKSGQNFPELNINPAMPWRLTLSLKIRFPN
jgi:hypothetical protein